MAENARVIERLVEAFNAKDFDLADTLYSADFVTHSPAPYVKEQALGGTGTQSMRSLAEGIPDAHCDVIRLVEKGDLVVAHSHVRGRHENPLGPFPPTGEEVVLELINIFRIEDGKIAEVWGLLDSLDLMRQLGLDPVRA